MCVIALASVVGTLLPQGGMTERSVRLAEQKYGPHLHRIFGALGLYDMYRSWWFVALLGLFTANNLACLSTRRLRLKSMGFLVTHLSIATTAAGVVIGAVWGEKGFVQNREKQTNDGIRSRRGLNAKWGFQLRLDDFILERYGEPVETLRAEVHQKNVAAEFPVKVGSMFHLGGTDYDFTILRYVPDFFIDLKTKKVSSKSNQPNNPALQVEIAKDDQTKKAWIFAKFAGRFFDMDGDADLHLTYVRKEGGRIKDFKSALTVIDGGTEAVQKTIVVNDPLRYKGYTFYQSSYDAKNLSWSGLQVTRDPGVPVVYAGFGLLILGVTIVFYINPYLAKRSEAKA